MQHNDFHSDFVDKSFDKLSPVDFAQEKWKLVYPVANASCILSMYFLASRESGPMMEIVGWNHVCVCVFACIYVQGGPGSQYSRHEEVLWR